ncbi:heme lyase CcmF/NrfE family subunit [Pseudoduganella namucuonensis]|uniref:Cytochrome c-type biogenesis protein CcmF n=1 Tax=Pseudoduganella namucuonensis TaxID=1035707 RepID=A0A1I7M659_9BURK|nr:heme lyase CcmF/NrfE family subunit [Pseudoduganella namucuonensis]SFV17441.1 cytochrome c-type biogenesis protein CcmF [Pseudoduganella namucuonensis]
MIAELGNFALMLALSLALLQGSLPLLGAWRGQRRWIALARPAAWAQALFVTAAFGCLLYLFSQNDFSVQYVAAHSNSMLPLHFRLAGAWGGHEGSLLLWVQILAVWTAAVAFKSAQLPEEMTARVLGVLGLVSVGFLSFMLFTSNPFDRLLPAARDGRDLNPLLQDLGMIIHPPLLYMGYVGFSVAFAFAIAALLGGRLDAAWARWSRPWTLVAWAFLTLGIFMGSFWAYYELGWGGWWFWDAVENASFMPWLLGTALLHSLAVTEKRGGFRTWTVLLAILAFSLSLLGTFLVRSGVLTSVHAFATDPERGLFILVFLAIVIGGALGLYAWRAPTVGLGGRFALFSRESLLLLNNVLLVTAAASVLLGTLYPLFLDALGMGKISVGPPYFEAAFVPLMLPVLLVLAAGPFAAWKSDSVREVLRRLAWVAQASVLAGAAALFGWKATPMVAGGLLLAVWVALGTALHMVQRLAPAEGGSLRARISRQPGAWWGMLAAHAGIAVFVAGVTLVKGTETSQDESMRVGYSVKSGTLEYRFVSLEKVDGPNYIAARGTFEVWQGERRIALLAPEKRYYTVQQAPMTEAAIDRAWNRDLYLSLGEPGKDGAWLVRIQHKPFVGWIWAGCLLIASGGFLAASDRRYRVRRRAEQTTGAALAGGMA